jgi:hypothetical protein
MDFSELITLTEWTNALDELIAKATLAIQNNDEQQITDLQDVLLDFQRQSPPNFESLDTIAFKISLELNRVNRTTALINIRKLAQELKDLNRILGVATANANQSADVIQLKSTKEILNKAKTSLTILKGLRDDLADNSTNLGQKVAAVFEAIQDFENAFPDA